ncbi:hypothetical protein [Carboxylicivirga sp. N1Y90]|uniref:hypothetical protein n=1 Tax=Carboxylicivirga fragile TaxID=3417571 RepID=UPI003D350FE2|nr:hypothetical protein [Marinilabiliaceae bacterium N1Y90]
MKTVIVNIFIALSFILIMSNCKKDDPIKPQETKIISITLPAGFYQDYPEQSIKNSGHVFITDAMGDLIIESELVNNTTLELTSDFDTNKEFDITFLRKTERINVDDIPYTTYYLKTFIDVKPYVFEFLKNERQKSNGEQIEIVINNTNGYLDDFTFIGSYGSINWGNRAEYTTSLKRIPDNIYVSFKHENENLRKYVLLENLIESSTIDVDYNELPVIEDMVTINYPENERVWIEVRGALASDPNYFFAPLAREISYTGDRAYGFNIPTSLFHKFELTTNIYIDTERFFTREVASEVNNNYSKPDLDYQVLNETVQGFEASSSSDYDYYTADFWYKNEIENYNVLWSICGESRNNFKLTIPDIIDLLDEEKPMPIVNDFIVSSTKIENVEGIESYKDYIMSVMDPNSKEAQQIVKLEYMSK